VTMRAQPGRISEVASTCPPRRYTGIEVTSVNRREAVQLG
jgi:hypothetical protein